VHLLFFRQEKYLSAKLKKQKKLKKAKGDGASEIENILSVIPTPRFVQQTFFQLFSQCMEQSSTSLLHAQSRCWGCNKIITTAINAFVLF